MAETRDSVRPGRGRGRQSRAHNRPDGKRPRRSLSQRRRIDAEKEGPRNDVPGVPREGMAAGEAGAESARIEDKDAD